MPKINQEEYEVLKSLDDAWKWIARDKNGGLYKFQEKPKKVNSFRWNDRNQTWLGMSGDRFQFIQWEDESPYNIQELIEEYLYDNQPKLFIDGQEQSFEFIEESEETEVKDLEWVKSKLKKDHKDGEVAKSQIKDGEKIDGIDLNSYWRGRQTANYIARCYLEDLDEPETLSEDWIQEHSYNVHLLGTPDVTTVAVPREDLQNLLVPKQEITEEQAWEIIHGKYGDEVLQNNIDYVESQGYVVIEKPTVPQFMADWHVQNKYYLLGAKFERIADSEDKRVVDWYRQCSGRHNNKLSNAQETIALMDLVGYEVEVEPKYYVLDSEEIPLLERVNNQTCKTTTGLSIYEDGRDNSRFELTEQEIKDYDERFWPFAVKVEELEE